MIKIIIKKLIPLFLLIILVGACCGCSSAITKLQNQKNHESYEQTDNNDQQQKKDNNGQKQYKQQQTPQPAPQPTPKEETKSVGSVVQTRITKIVDGDTFYVDACSTRIRLIGVNCPEIETAAGQAASRYVSSIMPVGTTVWIESDVGDTDKYGRPLRYVWFSNPGNSVTYNDLKTKSLNGMLLTSGNASIMSIQPNVKYATWLNNIASGR